MLTSEPRTALTFALLLAAGLGGCSCDGDTGAPFMLPDAGPPADAAWDIEVLPLYANNLEHKGIYGLELSPDDSTLMFCSRDSHVGFLDAESLTVLDALEVPELAAFGTERGWICRMSRIGDYAYAFFQRSSDNRDSAVVKLSWTERRIVDVWMLPDEFIGGAMNVDFAIYHGLQPTDDPNVAVISQPGDRGNHYDGLDAIFVDLTTGEFTQRTLIEDEDVRKFNLYSLMPDGRLVGFVYHSEEGYSILADTGTGEVVWRHSVEAVQEYGVTLSSAQHLAVDPTGERMLATRVPSVGWQMWSLSDGSLLRRGDYVLGGGFDNFMRWLPGGRLLHLAAGSRDSWLTILDEESLVPLATAKTPPDSAMNDYRLSSDGRRLYMAASLYVCKVDIPQP